MKKLIDVAAVNAMKGEGKSIIYIDKDTLVTPAARDAIDTNGMTIKEGSRDDNVCFLLPGSGGCARGQEPQK